MNPIKNHETKTLPALAGVPETAVAIAAEAFARRFAGRFVLLYRLGRGGMGEVYAAYDPELDRKVAVKILRSGSAEGSDADTRREARALARLNHPNVVKVYDVVSAGEELAIAMELVEGRTLGDWLSTGRRSWREIVEVFVGAGRGLAAAHAAGVIHRDFKPGNVMRSATGEVRVVDFGIALDDGDAGANGTRDDLGTPAYLAPERLGAEPADARSDQFSFCVALYEALVGGHPFFDPADRTGSLERLRAGRLVENNQPRAFPGWLEQALLRGLRPAPEERFASMEALLAVLERGLDRRRWAWLAVAAGLLVAAGGLAGGGLAGRLLVPPQWRELCAGAERQLRGVWDAERKQQTHAAFAATGLALAEETWPRVETALDGYAAEWLAMKRDACEATHRRGEQSEQVLDLRMLCLDTRRVELSVVSERLAAADREGVARASETVGSLAPIAECGASVELTMLTPLPPDPAVRAKIETLNAEVSEQDARHNLGLLVDADVAERLVEQAHELGYAPLEARALAVRARERIETRDVAGAVAVAEQALRTAIAGDDRLLQARLYGQLVELTGFYQADHEKARLWKRFVEASIAGLGARHPEIEFANQLDLSYYALSIGELPENIARSRRALEIGERLWGPDDLRLAPVHNNLGIALKPELERFEGEGVWHLERALAIHQKHLGASNPRLAPALANLAAIHADAGRYGEALELVLRSLRLLYDFYPDGGAEVAYPELLAGQILMWQDHPVEAEAHLRTALGSAARSLGEQHLVVLSAQLTQGRVLVLQNRLEAAAMALASAEKIAQATLPPSHEDRFEVLEARGQWLLESGYPERAHATFERARAMAEVLALAAGRRSAALCGLGEAELALGWRGLARRHLEAALELAQPGSSPLQNARIRWALARLLAPAERARARALAEAALTELPGTSPWSRRLRSALEAWLAASA